MNKAKVPCDLITGQEREEIEGAKHKAVTVEMADVTSNYDCAVIDEIQACRMSMYYVDSRYSPSIKQVKIISVSSQEGRVSVEVHIFKGV